MLSVAVSSDGSCSPKCQRRTVLRREQLRVQDHARAMSWATPEPRPDPGANGILDRVLALTRARFRMQDDALRAADDLFEALGMDSVQALELLPELERAFGVELPDYELRSFSDLAERIAARV